ncbi:uncharacterized protein [Chelonus insularis]|uniref:uncharacterized protein isoform X2 n=1 Tax=Chelonus insularis TaxID=460826 RepID=UPI00158973D6|nr:uncharacterized protein LOC118069680 isoform X2 [Chelonus insularis]
MYSYVAISLLISVFGLTPDEIEAQRSGWNVDPNTQYHIQTDEGPERYFRFQTLNGQFRKEKRLEDGTVIGTEGWLDPLGYLRIKDYIADREGFRILKSKMIFVGKDRPIEDAVAASKRVPPTSGILTTPRRPPNPFRQSSLPEISSNSIESNTIKPLQEFSPLDSTKRYSSSSTTPYPKPSYFSTTIAPIAITNGIPKPIAGYIKPNYPRRSGFRRPYYRKPYPFASPVQSTIAASQFNQPESIKVTPESSYGVYRHDSRRYRAALASEKFNNTRQIRSRRPNLPNERSDSQTSGNNPVFFVNSPNSRKARIAQGSRDYDFPPYDGTHTTSDGFQYYLKTHYHEEEQQPDKSIGSFGYIDPFGIRRVVYYKADGQDGFFHKKNNRYVGFDATPYDPVPPKTN